MYQVKTLFDASDDVWPI